MNNLKYDDLVKKCNELEQKLKFYQEYDSLTNVLNKTTFYHYTSQLLQTNPSKQYAIIAVDIERFKVINDLYGTEKGNELLYYIASQLSLTFQSEDSNITRLSGDIFALFLANESLNIEQMEQTIKDIFHNAPVDMDIKPAIGVYQIKDRTLSVEKMCDRAILASNSIKGKYQKFCAIYDENLWASLLKEQEIISRADYALANNEFQVYFQPKCNMRTGKVIGAEALVRWIHPENGIISPAAFIPVFEQNGFIRKLDAFIWEKVVQWLDTWKKAGHELLPISVNVSRLDILGRDLCSTLEAIIKKYDVPNDMLELEITESAYTSQFDEITSTVNHLMNLGYTVLMDDFGSGYSSLNMLKEINIDILKLDLKFLDKTNSKSRDILESIVHMAKWLNLKVIAEGVETRSQIDFLLTIGCEYAQGYYFYQPMDSKAFETLMLDQEKIDFSDQFNNPVSADNVIKFKDLFHADMMSEELLNNIIGGIALYEYNGSSLVILSCNNEYYNITKHDPIANDLCGVDILTLIHDDDRQEFIDLIEEAHTSGHKGSSFVTRRYISDEEFIWIEIRLFYLAESKGNRIFYAGVSDVSERMHSIERLRLSEKRFRIAMENLKTTLFEVDIATRTASFATHTKDEFALDDVATQAPEGFIRQGSVREEYIDDFCKMYETIYSGADSASCIVQANMANNAIAWNRITLTAIKNKDGKSIKAVGLVENITKEKQLEEQLKKAEG